MIDILQNSIMQSFIFSPIMGVIFGSIFAGLTTRPSFYTPKTVTQTYRIYIDRKTIVARESSRDNGEAIMGISALLMFILWKYVQLAPSILYFVEIGLMTMFSFCMTIFIVSTIKGQYTSHEWLMRVLCPAICLVFCFPLLNIAKQAISSDLIELANNTGVWQFYFKGLTQYGRFFLLSQVLGVCFLVLLVLTSTFVFVHYLALMNQREYSPLYGLWDWLAENTIKYSGGGVSIALIMLLSVTIFLLNGEIALWLNSILA